MMNVNSNPNVITKAPKPIAQATNHSLSDCATITNCVNTTDNCSTIACIGCGIGCCAVTTGLGLIAAPSLAAAKTTTTTLAIKSIGTSSLVATKTITSSLSVNLSCGGCGGGAKMSAVGARVLDPKAMKVAVAGAVVSAVVRAFVDPVVKPVIDNVIEPVIESAKAVVSPVLSPVVERVIEREAQPWDACFQPKSVNIQEVKFCLTQNN